LFILLFQNEKFRLKSRSGVCKDENKEKSTSYLQIVYIARFAAPFVVADDPRREHVRRHLLNPVAVVLL
jgi:hypothetical protein